MIEGKRKAQDHEGQKPFDSGVIETGLTDVITAMIEFPIYYGELRGCSAGVRAERVFVPNAKGRKGVTSRQTHSTDTWAILETSTIAMSCARHVTTSSVSSSAYPLSSAPSLIPCTG